MVAFEVIEHLDDWRGFLREARRVLAPNGQFIVSTPNKLYYTESRGADGANPFHVHEFDFEEFRAELRGCLPARFAVPRKPRGGLHVSAARSRQSPRKCAWMPAMPSPDESHFFVAVCANRPQIG